MFIQQGDVILISVNEIKGKKLDPLKRGYVLAEGETTGHAHVIEETENVNMYNDQGEIYLSVDKSVVLKHEEHNQVIIEPGIYEVKKVQEYDHFAEEARNVQD